MQRSKTEKIYVKTLIGVVSEGWLGLLVLPFLSS